MAELPGHQVALRSFSGFLRHPALLVTAPGRHAPFTRGLMSQRSVGRLRAGPDVNLCLVKEFNGIFYSLPFQE
jgi:hypothetical protein